MAHPLPAPSPSRARAIVRPSELDFANPGRRDYWVALEHDSLWADHLLPLTVLVGREAAAGRGVLAIGGNHGDEYEGPVALKRLLDEIRVEDVVGRIVIVPVLNVAAFAAGARDSVADDRVNLNRAFVDGAGETPALRGITHRIAAFVRAHLWPHAHVVIDLHAGGEVARFAPCASFHPLDDPAQRREIAETAAWFGTPFLLIYQNATPGLLPSEAERLGKIAIGGEFGWGRAVDPDGVGYARQGVLAAAIRHGQLRGAIARHAHHAAGTQRTVDIAPRECVVVAPAAGLFERAVACGTDVRAGDVVGWIHDFERIDEPPLTLTAPIDGVVVVQAWAARVRRGQHVTLVGRVVR